MFLGPKKKHQSDLPSQAIASEDGDWSDWLLIDGYRWLWIGAYWLVFITRALRVDVCLSQI